LHDTTKETALAGQGRRECGLGTFKRPKLPYDRFMDAEGVPVYRGIGFTRVHDLPMAPWQRLAGAGLHSALRTEGLWACMSSRCPVQARLNVERHLYEKICFASKAAARLKSGRKANRSATSSSGRRLAVHHSAERVSTASSMRRARPASFSAPGTSAGRTSSI